MSIKKFLNKNSNIIAAAAAIGGVASVAYFAARDTRKADQILLRAQVKAMEEGTTIPKRASEKFAVTWKCYIPTAISMGVTVSSILALNYLGERRVAAASAAVALSEAAFSNYRNKVIERLGDEEAEVYKSAKAEPLQKRTESTMVIVGDDDVLFMDEHSGRYFRSNVTKIREAVNETNAEIFNSVYVSLADFYDRIGLEPTPESDEIGWNSDCLMAVSFEPIMAENNKPALLMSYDARPFGGYSTLRP